MVDEVVIRSSNSSGKLILSDPEYHTDSRLNYFVATVKDVGLEVSSRVYAYGAETLARLFEDIAVNWKGWEGDKLGSTIESDLILTCTSDSLGHTFVRVRLLSHTYNWNVETTIRLDAAQLDEIAKRLRNFLNVK